jgi:hypothetical protein
LRTAVALGVNMSEPRFRDQEHLLRLAGLALLGVLAFLLLRGLLVPHDFGVLGHYRASALDDNRKEPISFAGQDACLACHEDTRAGGKHGGVRCEACHGAMAAHAESDDPAASAPSRPPADLCEVCHLANVAKPASFPQVDLKQHAEPGSCLTCHKAHRPDEAPEEAP